MGLRGELLAAVLSGALGGLVYRAATGAERKPLAERRRAAPEAVRPPPLSQPPPGAPRPPPPAPGAPPPPAPGPALPPAAAPQPPPAGLPRKVPPRAAPCCPEPLRVVTVGDSTSSCNRDNRARGRPWYLSYRRPQWEASRREGACIDFVGTLRGCHPSADSAAAFPDYHEAVFGVTTAAAQARLNASLHGLRADVALLTPSVSWSTRRSSQLPTWLVSRDCCGPSRPRPAPRASSSWPRRSRSTPPTARRGG
eukprot:TRINITY_DN33060_c0_g1_i1.p2 TRINITY_DN33060_c0_g1~~TRINITY_DN33060_c0_g1_i1.p2  ORF type:complete len:253 (+),score=20.30 TRINITY_DN33060_c0_g1_i1:94-852(+)